HRVGENLRLPSQAVRQSKIRTNLPLVLHEERVVLIAYIGGSSSVRGSATRARVLEVKEQRAGSGRPAAGAGAADTGHERSVRAFRRGRAKARSSRGRRGVMQEAQYRIKNVAAREEPAEYLGIVAVQPLAPEFHRMLAGQDGEVVPQLDPLEDLIDLRF